MGVITKRGSIYSIRYYRNGRQYRESSRSTKYEAAERLLRLREGAIAKGEAISPAVATYTFDQAAKELLNDYLLNGRRSRDAAERRLRLHLTPAFGGWRMMDITRADVTAYCAERREAGAKPATVNRELAALKRMFTLAVQGGRLLSKPHIPMLKERNVRTGFFERDQFEAVRSRLPEALQPLVTFAYYTGWRKGEVLPLEWRQVDRVAGVIRLDAHTTKNDDGRVLPYAALPELRMLITAQWQEHERLRKAGVICPWVFHRNGRPIRSYRKAWQVACTAAGVPGRIPHDFRRTAARNMVRAGIGERVAMQLTGHKTPSVFHRYAIVNEADLRDAVGRLALRTRDRRPNASRAK
jgi:integrase